MIVMTAAEADAVRGVDAPGHALEPMPLADGVTWVLPLSVLDDPAHAAKHAALASYSTRDVNADEFPVVSDPDA